MLILAILAFTVAIGSCNHVFMFAPTTKITHLDNYQNNERPCKDDHIIFEQSKKTVVFVDASIGVSEMQLPDDGVLYFGNDVVLGLEKNYQCERRKSPEDVFFEPEISFGSFFNPAHWQHDHDPMLHMNMVPGIHDEVYLFNGIQIFLEEQANCASLSIQERYFTTSEFDEMLHTVEGQFRVSLGHKVGKKQSLDGVEFDIPTKSPIIVTPLVLSDRDKLLGLANPNRKNETLSLICQYVKCLPTEDICVEPVKPVGHCCPECGAIIDFSGMEPNRSYLWEHLLGEFLQRNLVSELDLNLERLDEDGAPVDYQISVFPAENRTFNEELFKQAVGYLEKVLERQTNYQNTIFHYESKISMVDRRYQKVSKIFGVIASLLLISTMIVFALNRDTNIFTTMKIPKDFYSGVVWRRGSTVDQIQLVNTNHIDNQNFTSDPEEDSEGVSVQTDVVIAAPKEQMTSISLLEPVASDETSEVEELPLVEF